MEAFDRKGLQVYTGQGGNGGIFSEGQLAEYRAVADEFGELLRHRF